MKRNLKIVAACQDVGGYNAVYPVVRELRKKGSRVSLFASGYCAKSLKEKRLNFTEIPAGNYGRTASILEKERPDLVLLGSSCGYSLEDAFVEEARRREIPSLAILDSWVNYSARFSSGQSGRDLKYLPQRVCVMDQNAKREMIAEGVPAERIAVTGNPYLDGLVKETRLLRDKRREKLLKDWRVPQGAIILAFFSQAIDKTFGLSLGYTQRDALQLFIRAVKSLRDDQRQVFVIIRPHPKEGRPFYKELREPMQDIPFIVDYDNSARQLLAVSDIAAGMFSSMLVEAYMLGKGVLTIQPSSSEKDDFILSRLGLLKPGRCLKDVKRQLGILYRSSKVGLKRPRAYPCGRATSNVIGLIKELKARGGQR